MSTVRGQNKCISRQAVVTQDIRKVEFFKVVIFPYFVLGVGGWVATNKKMFRFEKKTCLIYTGAMEYNFFSQVTSTS